MISYIRGLLTEISEDSIVIECNGIGYQCFCGVTDLGYFASIRDGQNVTVYTYLSHKEDSMTLYGFATKENRDGFLTLLKVDGVGPKMALKMLSAYKMSQIQAYIEAEDVNSLKKIPGLGTKGASKMILALKGKLVFPSQVSVLPIGITGDLISALVNMGYDESAVRACLNEHKPETEDFSREFKRYIKLIKG